MEANIIPVNKLISSGTFNGERILRSNQNKNKLTDTNYLFVATDSGSTYIMKITTDGVKIRSQIEIPDWNTKKERNKIIINLHKNGYKQSEIAFFLDISQSTVSKKIQEWKEKK